MTNQSIAAGKRYFKTAASTVIALFIIVSIFASVVFAADNSTVDVKIVKDAQERTVATVSIGTALGRWLFLKTGQK